MKGKRTPPSRSPAGRDDGTAKASRAKRRLATPAEPGRDLTKAPPPEPTSPLIATTMVEGLVQNAATAAAGYSQMLGPINLAQSIAAVGAAARQVTEGSLAGLEATLTAQAVTLNAMFTQLSYQASQMSATAELERFTRLALKAQNQFRVTVETLALLKAPPTIYARQANIANGPQQVNNGVVVPVAVPKNDPNELMEAAHVIRVDAGEASTAVGRHPKVVSVGARHRTPIGRG